MSYQSDSVRSIIVLSILVSLKGPISDTKVITGLGFTYSLRTGGTAQYAHAKEVAGAAIGEDPSAIAKLYSKPLWAGASVGMSGPATQALAAIDIALYALKSKRANLPLAKFLGSYRDSVWAYNTSGDYLNSTLDEVKHSASQPIERGIGGIRSRSACRIIERASKRGETLREHIGGLL